MDAPVALWLADGDELRPDRGFTLDGSRPRANSRCCSMATRWCVGTSCGDTGVVR